MKYKINDIQISLENVDEKINIDSPDIMNSSEDGSSIKSESNANFVQE